MDRGRPMNRVSGDDFRITGARWGRRWGNPTISSRVRLLTFGGVTSRTGEIVAVHTVATSADAKEEAPGFDDAHHDGEPRAPPASASAEQSAACSGVSSAETLFMRPRSVLALNSEIGT